jgi:predicted nucleic acid-binding protein/predicted transcriptional regulator
MTVSIRLDEETEARLRRLLKQKGGSLSAFVRAAIAEKLEREGKKPTPYELGKHLFGRGRRTTGSISRRSCVPSIAVDAGPLVALFKGADNYHADAVAFIQRVDRALVTNLIVICEVVALLAPMFQTSFLEWADGAMEVDQETVGDMPRIVEIMQRYADLPADFADASLVAMCERRGIEQVASLDKHFDVYRTSGRRRFKNAFRAA